MQSILFRFICRIMAITMMMLPFQTGQAGMIGTDQAHAAAAAQLDRGVVISYLNRAQTVSEFQALGLDPEAARDRVAAMSDADISTLAGKIHSAPAGGDGLIAVILVVFFIWFFAFRR